MSKFDTGVLITFRLVVVIWAYLRLVFIKKKNLSTEYKFTYASAMVDLIGISNHNDTGAPK